MQRIEDLLFDAVQQAAVELWNAGHAETQVQIQKTKKEFVGDRTVVVFPLVKLARTSPEETGRILGEWITGHLDEVEAYNVVKGFLNLTISGTYWLRFFSDEAILDNFGIREAGQHAPLYMVEYSSPNTNKPLHLGHIRNNLLGYAVSRILEASGKKVVKVNIVNDRGIHICKSMLAWQKFGDGETPESSGIKGDHLVGKYYVIFDREHKKQVEQLVGEGMDRKKAEENTPLLNEAREMLRKWEADDAEIRSLWEKMNAWVYDGFDQTYARMGVSFDKIYYESDTYKLGKTIVDRGIQDGILTRESDGSVWADLTDRNLDRKLLRRSDGTSVYMTQDLGTAHQRYEEFPFDKHIYVVGNEQNYHFQVLEIILEKLGFEWASRLFHLSYGMVELPEGKMKSREGTVVDADDLMDEMILTAKNMSEELGKLDEYNQQEKENIYRQIGLGALKYFILKVDPRKNMLFDPRESIDFNGNTGPFIQYSYARIQSVLKKADKLPEYIPTRPLIEKEIGVVKLIYDFPEIVQSAADTYNPSGIANYLYDLAKEFNQFYHDHSILNAEDDDTRSFRIHLARITGQIIEKGMGLLGIEVPERM
jgi:arginyl-tRNA synthetase